MKIVDPAENNIKFEHLWDDACAMADTLRQIESVCKKAVICSEDLSNIDEICRILFLCTAPYESDYLSLTSKKTIYDRTKAVLKKYT